MCSRGYRMNVTCTWKRRNVIVVKGDQDRIVIASGIQPRHLAGRPGGVGECGCAPSDSELDLRAQMPLSSWSGTSRRVQASQSLQVCSTEAGRCSFLTDGSSISRVARKPDDACHAMWQCHDQTPDRAGQRDEKASRRKNGTRQGRDRRSRELVAMPRQARMTGDTYRDEHRSG